MNSRCFKLYRAYSIPFDSSNVGNFFRVEFLRTDQSAGKEKESGCPAFPSATKRAFTHFHVVVVQRRQRNVQKSVTHVQSCCSAYLNLLFFCRSRCRRRRRCLSSLPFLAINSLPDWTHRSFCLARCKAPGNIWVLPVNLSPTELHRLTVLPGFPWSPRSPDIPGAPLKDSESFVEVSKVNSLHVQESK